MWMLTWFALAYSAPGDLLQQGMEAQRGGNVAVALQRYQDCINEDPDFVACHWEIGWSYWTLGNWEKVVEHWRKVRFLDPNHPQVNRHLPRAEAKFAQSKPPPTPSTATPEPPTAADPPVTKALTPVRPGQKIRIRAVGDLMLGTDFPPDRQRLPQDDNEVLNNARSVLLDADLTFGNLQAPLCDGGTTTRCRADAERCGAVRTPTRFATALRNAGFDLLSIANDHATDFGESCQLSTEQTLRSTGIAYSGRPGTIATANAQGMRVGMIAFHTRRSGHYLNDHEAAARLVSEVAASHNLTIVSFHGGAEGENAQRVPTEMEYYFGEERGNLRKFAHRMISAGADLVLGHGPRVPRGLELVNGHLVAYSLGNFAAYGQDDFVDGPLATTFVLEAILNHDGKLTTGKVIPFKLGENGIPVRDRDGASIESLRTLSYEDFGDAAPSIAEDGRFMIR